MTAVAQRPTSTSELLLAWDRQRPRSLQRELGMSELGGCERRAGYRLAGAAPTNASGSVQAVLGTAIHAAVQQVLTDVAEPGDLVEHPVMFAGIPGHIDRYEAAARRLIDVKTTSSRWLEHIKLEGPDRSHRWQTAGYAGALIASGTAVDTIRIDYIARDTGEEWSHERRFDLQEARDALAWVAQVRDADVEMLNRRYAPDSAFCQHCPFLNTCWGPDQPGRDRRAILFAEDPDALSWVEKLDKARKDKAAAEEREAEARGALTALQPSVDRGTHLVDVGLPDRLLAFQVTYPERLDTAAVKQEYAKTGARPPYKPADKPQVKVGFAAKAADA